LSASHDFLRTTIQRLRQLTHWSIQGDWRWHCAHTSDPTALPPWSQWQPAPLNARHHIAWDRGGKPLWLRQQLRWPSHRHGYALAGLSVALDLRWWAEQADIYVNGTRVQTGDLFDCFTRLPLCPTLVPGDCLDLSLRLVSPRHDDGALVTSALSCECLDSSLALDPISSPEPSFVADELAIADCYLRQLDPAQHPALTAAAETIAWDALSHREQFHQSLGQMRASLATLMPWFKTRTIHCIGHAHLDLAWLWPLADTWQAAERTFTSVLALQQEFPELTYTHSSPALFAHLQSHRPDLFRAIQDQVRQGRWAIDAGLWVEPDLNLISGESIVRQILYGQRYCQAQFGQLSSIAWLPDSFGFSWQLPQLLRQGGIRYFATQKLRWNDSTEFPHHWFWWQGLDGTTIASLTLPPIGADLDPLAMATYAVDWEMKTHLKQCLWLPGVGDHGGGPTRAMVLRARRWAQSPFFPNVTFSRAVDVLDQFPTGAASPPFSPPQSGTPPQEPDLPIWRDELYLELHRGCYTTHGDQKRFNRQCEVMLYQAELFAALATATTDAPYPREALEQAWKAVLLNQFHDILPGSSIPEVFADANPQWQSALEQGYACRQRALTHLAQTVTGHPPCAEAIPILVFNSLNWNRSELVSLDLSNLTAQQTLNGQESSPTGWRVVDANGNPVPYQQTPSSDHPPPHPYPDRSSKAQPPAPLLFWAESVPSVGYRLYWLEPTPVTPVSSPLPTSSWVLENDSLQVTINPTTGDIARLWDKQHQQEVLQPGGSRLQGFQDPYQYWDAWNIDPDYAEHPLPPLQLQNLRWLEHGPLRQSIRVVRRLGTSRITQDYILEQSSQRVDIATTVDWHESETLLKAIFPLTITAEQASYEIPFGVIQRPTQPARPHERAKWEVPALTWADLSTPTYGFSVLTAGKHGFSAAPSSLSLSLLNATTWPDPKADRGHHQFTYAIYPHRLSYREADTVRQAAAFNQPLIPYPIPGIQLTESNCEGNSDHSFLSLGQNSLILTTFKLAEEEKTNASHTYILRFYESQGLSATLELKTNGLPPHVSQATLLEHRKLACSETNSMTSEASNASDAMVKPWQVQTLLLHP